MAPGTPNLMAETLVKPGREAEFEDFVINVIVPAGRRTKPHLEDGWQLLRPSDNPPEGVTSAYMFVFYGDAPLEEWDLEPLFNQAYGPEEGRQHLDRFLDLIDGEQTLYAFGGEVTRS